MNQCVLIVWASQSKSKPETRKEYNKYLNKLDVDTTYSFQLDTNYIDSLNLSPYALYNYKIQKGYEQSLEQIKIYTSSGELYYGYDVCFSPAMFYELLDSVPFNVNKPHLEHNLNKAVNFNYDINYINASETTKKQLLEKSKQHEFTILLTYTMSSGIISRRMIKDLNEHIKKNNVDVFVIYLNTSP